MTCKLKCGVCLHTAPKYTVSEEFVVIRKLVSMSLNVPFYDSVSCGTLTGIIQIVVGTWDVLFLPGKVYTTRIV